MNAEVRAPITPTRIPVSAFTTRQVAANLLKLSDEFVGVGSDGEGGVSGILHAHLVKYACKGEFAAEGVAAMLEIHLSGLIGISLR